MKIEFRTVGHDSADAPSLGGMLLGLLSSKAQTEHCTCLDCVSERIVNNETAPPDEEMMPDVIKRSLGKVLEQVGVRAEACAKACVMVVERAAPAEFSNALYARRVDVYNAYVRCARTLFSLLPADEQAEIGKEKLPDLVSWEQAVANLENIRSEIVEAVAKRKAGGYTKGRALGTELAQLLKAAMRDGRSREDIVELLVGAAEHIRTEAARTQEEEQPAPTTA